MPHFTLRWTRPAMVVEDWRVEMIRMQAISMARAVQEVAWRHFQKPVSFEVVLSSDSDGLPDFSLSGMITDNDDSLVEIVRTAQSEMLKVMRERTYTYQKVECWWIRVKGVWGEGFGQIPTP